MTEKPPRSFEGMASIWAAIIGGVFAIVAAFLPSWLERSKTTPAPTTIAEAASDPVVALPNLTLGTWTIRASADDEGTDFSSSLLKITSQKATPDGLEVTGVFVWRCNLVDQGQEHFTGRYVAATRQLFIEGQKVESLAGARLTPGCFSARLSDDGRELLDGTWGSTLVDLANVPGSWEAYR